MKRPTAMPRRMLLLAAVAVAAALAVVFAVAWQQLDPGPLHRIVVSNVSPDGPGFWQIAIDDDNRYVFAHDAVEERGRIAFAPFAARLAPAYELRLSPNSGPDGRAGIAFWMEGRRRTVAPFIPTLYAGHERMRDFASALHDAVAADVRRKKKPLVDALTSLHDLRSVDAESKGCFGTCGVYTITLRSDRTGTLVWKDAGVPTPHRANRIDWNGMVAALREAHVERLERKYASNMVDTQSAGLHFTFAAFSYAVEAPDSSNWPPEFRDAFRALRHAAAQSAWSPPLSAYQIERLAR